MKEFFVKLLRRFGKNQNGFTLAELIVVVAIIVGLAAVILPNVGRFTGQGETGALTAEKNSVQTALDGWIAHNSMATTLQGHTSGDAVRIPAASGVAGEGDDAVNLFGFLRLAAGATQTIGYYCWDSFGAVTQVPVVTAGVAPACP